MDKFTAHLVLSGGTVDIAADTLDSLVFLCEKITLGGPHVPVREWKVEEVSLVEVPAILAPEDNPGAGADPAILFGGAAVPLPPGALSSAAAEASPTAQTTSIVPPVPPAPAPNTAAEADAPPASAALTSPAVTVDKHGLPWDERIHASTKATIADGSWRAKRGVTEALVAQVEAELRQVMAIPAPAASPSVVPLPPPAPDAAPSASNILSFPEQERFALLMTYLTPFMTPPNIRLTNEQAIAVLAEKGFPGWPALIVRPDMVGEVWAAFEAVLA